LKVYQQLADKYRFEKLEITDLASLHAIDFTQLIRMQAVPLWKIALVGRDFKKWMFRDLADIALFDGIPQLLERLAARGTLLALVSSNSTKNVRGVLGPEIAGLFHYYECGVALFGKQAKFQRILRKSGVAPEQAFSVGDEVRDIEAAHAARIPCGAVTWGYTGVPALAAKSPSALLNTVSDLAASLEVPAE
jgi:phosphoglycolate phosphatase